LPRNTLLSRNKDFIREVTPDRQTVWQFSRRDFTPSPPSATIAVFDIF
jgi:hypothetical protein